MSQTLSRCEHLVDGVPGPVNLQAVREAYWYGVQLVADGWRLYFTQENLGEDLEPIEARDPTGGWHVVDSVASLDSALETFAAAVVEAGTRYSGTIDGTFYFYFEFAVRGWLGWHLGMMTTEQAIRLLEDIEAPTAGR